MGVFDILGSGSLRAPEDEVDTGFTDQFGKGLNSGLTGIGSGLRAMVGTGAEALGFDEFAQDQYAAAREAQKRAQMEAPRVTSYKQVMDEPSLRNASSYLGGLLGGSAPSIAAGTGAALMTGGAAVPAMLAATAAQVPIEAADVASKQLNDPEAMQMGAGERMGRQWLGGAGSAALQGIVPGALAGKMLGRGAGEMAKQSAKGIIGRNLVGGTLAEAGLEGASDALKQTASNDARELDWESIKENVIGGGVAGGAMGSVGAAADLMHAAPRKAITGVQEGFNSAVEGTQEALAPHWESLKAGAAAMKDAMPEGVKEAMDSSGKTIKEQADAARAKIDELMQAEDVPAEIKAQLADAGKFLADKSKRAYVWAADKVRGEAERQAGDDIFTALQKAGTPEDDSADRVLRDQPLDNDNEIASGATDGRVQEILGKTTEWGKKHAVELLRKAGLTDEQRNKITETVNNWDDKLSPKVIAGVSKGVKGAEAIASRISSLTKGISDSFKASATDGTKKSEEYTGFDKRLLEEVAPVAIQAMAAKHGVEAEAIPMKEMQQLAPVLRQIGQKFAQGDKFDVALVRLKLADLLGSDGASSVLQAMAPMVTGNNREAAANYFRNLTTFDQEAKAHKGVLDVIEQYGKKYKGNKGALADTLVKWASGHFDNASMTPDQRRYNDIKVQDHLDEVFGPKAKNVLAALERAYGERRGQTLAEDMDSEGAKLAELSDAAPQYIGGGKNKRAALKKPHVGADEFGNDSTSRLLMEDIKNKDGSRVTEFVTVSDPKRGATVLEKMPAFKKFRTEQKKAIEAKREQYMAEARVAAEQEGRDDADYIAQSWMDEDLKKVTDAKVKEMAEKGQGMVEVTGYDDNTTFNQDQIDEMRMDTTHSSDKANPHRLAVTGEDGKTSHVFDATRVTGTAMKQINVRRDWTPQDDKSQLHRIARAFKEGAANLMAEVGPFEIPDSTIIYRDPKNGLGDVRFKDIKNLDHGVKSSVHQDAAGREYWVPRKMSENEAAAEAPATTDAEDYEQGMGKQDADAKGQVHLAAARLGENKLQVRVDEAGDVIKSSQGQTNYSRIEALNSTVKRLETAVMPGGKAINKVGRAVGSKARALYNHYMAMSPDDQAAFSGLVDISGKADRKGPLGLNVMESAKVVNQLHEKYSSKFDATKDRRPKTRVTPEMAARTNKETAAKKAILAKMEAEREAREAEQYADEDGAVEGTPDPKLVAAKKAALVEAASSSNPELIKEIKASTDAKSLQRSVDALLGARNSYDPNSRNTKMLTSVASSLDWEGHPGFQDMLGELHKEMSSKTKDPDIVKYLVDSIHAELDKNAAPMLIDRGMPPDTAKQIIDGLKAQVNLQALDAIPIKWKSKSREYLDKVLGKNAVELVFDSDKLMMEGAGAQHTAEDGNEAIVMHSDKAISQEQYRSVLYHESAHALFARLLSDSKYDGVVKSLIETATSDHVLNQLDAIYAGDGGARTRAYYKANPEEAVAYAYQHWATGELKITDKPVITLFERIKDILAQFMRFLSSPQQTDLMFRYFKEGKLAEEFPNFGLQELLKSREKSIGNKWINYLGDTSSTTNSIDAINDRLTELTQDQDVKYSLLTKNDKQKATNSNPLSKTHRAQILKAIHELLGNSVQMEFASLMHAGEFFTKAGTDIIRVSVTAMNPMGTAYHEALHAFFKQMRTHGSEDVNAVLSKLANTPHVMKQLKDLLAHSPEALGQLSDPEERVAYMFQFFSMGHDFKLADAPKNLFTQLKEKFLKLMGIWTNDARAMHILEYFGSGEYAKQMGDHKAVRAALMETGQGKGMVAKVREMTGPFMDMAEHVLGAGSANLRDSGIPSLAKLADMIKKRGVDEGGDGGWLPAARLKRAEFLNKYASVIEGKSEADLNDALESMQNDVQPKTPGGKVIRAGVRKLLDDMYDYMHAKGVDVGDMGVGKNYFPRRWDAHYLSQHKDDFMAMARNYPQWLNPEETYNKLVANDGSEIQVITQKPGMASLNKRVLDFIDAKDAAPFMSKNLHMTLNSYITQATRRAEWANRFGDDNSGLQKIYEQAKAEGATTRQIKDAKDFVEGVNGTLGDSINPKARKLMGDMVVYQNIRLLPLAVFSMAIDPMGIVVNGGGLGQAFKTAMRGIKEIPKGLRGDTSMDAQTRFAQDMGTIDNAMLQHAIGSMYTQGVTGDFARKANDLFFRFNLVEQMNTSMRVGATEAARLFLIEHGTHGDKHSVRRLAELGLTKADVQIANGELVINDKIKKAINQWVDGAILRPDAADKPIWMNNPYFLLISHLKQFVYAFQHTTMARVLHEAKHGNYTPAMALSSYVPIMMFSDMLKGVLQGGGDVPEWKKNWDAGDYIGNAVQRAGLLGVGQFGLDAATGRIGTLTGPTVEQLVDLTAVMGGRESFKSFAMHSLPANQLFAGFANASKEDPMFAD